MFKKILFRLRFKLSRKFREKKWTELLGDAELFNELNKVIEQSKKRMSKEVL